MGMVEGLVVVVLVVNLAGANWVVEAEAKVTVEADLVVLTVAVSKAVATVVAL